MNKRHLIGSWLAFLAMWIVVAFLAATTFSTWLSVLGCVISGGMLVALVIGARRP